METEINMERYLKKTDCRYQPALPDPHQDDPIHHLRRNKPVIYNMFHGY